MNKNLHQSKCRRCNEISNDFFLFNCQHSICQKCAAHEYDLSQKLNKNYNTDFLLCQICKKTHFLKEEDQKKLQHLIKLKKYRNKNISQKRVNTSVNKNDKFQTRFSHVKKSFLNKSMEHSHTNNKNNSFLKDKVKMRKEMVRNSCGGELKISRFSMNLQLHKSTQEVQDQTDSIFNLEEQSNFQQDNNIQIQNVLNNQNNVKEVQNQIDQMIEELCLLKLKVLNQTQQEQNNNSDLNSLSTQLQILQKSLNKIQTNYKVDIKYQTSRKELRKLEIENFKRKSVNKTQKKLQKIPIYTQDQLNKNFYKKMNNFLKMNSDFFNNQFQNN